MNTRKLGSTDIEISPIVLGCMTFSGGANWGEQDENASINTIRAALDAGITTFDTAEGYANGLTETILGKALGRDREKAVILSKVAPKNAAYDNVIAACEASLARLGTDYLDLYMIHWPSREVPFEETMRAMEKLKTDGKVRAVGVSNFGVLDLDEILKCGVISANQLCYSMLFRGIEYSILPKCAENNIGVLTYSSLAQGLLTGKYLTADEFPVGRARTKHFSSQRREFARHGEAGHEEITFLAVNKIKVIADEMGVPMASLALAWSMARPGITGVVAGARTPAQAIVNAEAARIVIPSDVMAELTALTDGLKAEFGDIADPWADGRIR